MPAWSYNRVALVGQHLFQLGDVKSHPSELVSRVHDYHERVIVTVHGRPSAVLIAPEDLERLEETLEIMRDAATMNRLAESDAELARGEFVSAEELAEAMRQRRAQLAVTQKKRMSSGQPLQSAARWGRPFRKPSRRPPTNSSPALS